MKLSDKLDIPAQVMARDVGEEVVILDLASGTYFGLDPVGSQMWQHMSTGKTLAEICDAMLDEFDVTREELERDTLKLAEMLQSNGLVTLRQE
jgi:hypothetical protein